MNQIENLGLNSSSLSGQSNIVITNNDFILFGANTAVRIADLKSRTWKGLAISGQNPNMGSYRIFQDLESNVWISDFRGLFKLNTSSFLNYNSRSGLADDEVTAIYQSTDGSIYISNQAYMNRLKDGRIQSNEILTSTEPSSRILDIEEDISTNSILLAGNKSGLATYSNLEKPKPSIAYNDLRITSIEWYKDELYVTTNQALHEYKEGKLHVRDTMYGSRNMKSIEELLFVTTTWNGVYIFDGKSSRNIRSNNYDLSSVYQVAIYDNDTLLATRDGIGTMRDGEIKHW